ncbi:hypothetical protein ABT095_29640 [Kitasatospora sp. NPDC002227]|uniref:hypothetical protein n=1 Tax=Kitasatospora sp. NPDC002227 TaxID=3154773 RepID=UPI00331A7404
MAEDVLSAERAAGAGPLKVARALLAVVAVLWVGVMVGFGWLAVALGSAADAADGDGRVILFAQFGTGFAAVVAALPTLLWVIVAIAFWRGRRWAAALGIVAVGLAGLCTSGVLFGVALMDLGAYPYGLALLLNGLGVAGVVAAVRVWSSGPATAVAVAR